MGRGTGMPVLSRIWARRLDSAENVIGPGDDGGCGWVGGSGDTRRM